MEKEFDMGKCGKCLKVKQCTLLRTNPEICKTGCDEFLEPQPDWYFSQRTNTWHNIVVVQDIKNKTIDIHFDGVKVLSEGKTWKITW